MSACQEKCIPNNYHEPDLNKGEQKCIDRCVAKYMSIQFMLGEKMKTLAPTADNTSQIYYYCYYLNYNYCTFFFLFALYIFDTGPAFRKAYWGSNWLGAYK